MSYSRSAAISRLGSLWIDNIPPINLLSVGQLSMLRHQNPFAKVELSIAIPSSIEVANLVPTKSFLDSQSLLEASTMANGSTAHSTWEGRPAADILGQLREIHGKVQAMVKEQEAADKALEDYLLTPLPPLIQMQWRVFRQNRQITRDPKSLAFLLPAPFDRELRAANGSALFIEFQRLAFAKASPKEIAESLSEVSKGISK